MNKPRGGPQGSLQGSIDGKDIQHRSFGMFDLDEAGRLSPATTLSKLGLGFSWRGRTVTTALRAGHDPSLGVMEFRTQAGRVPSSALSAGARPDAFELLRCMPALLARGWKLTISPDHSLLLHSEMPVPMPALISDLLVPAVQFCLAVSPFLDLLEENAMGLRA